MERLLDTVAVSDDDDEAEGTRAWPRLEVSVVEVGAPVACFGVRAESDAVPVPVVPAVADAAGATGVF